MVFIALVVATAIEYVVPLAIDQGAVPYLEVLGLVKAGLILYYFMHLAHLWRQED